MERFKVRCKIGNDIAELQFDIKKMPGEDCICFMVCIDGIFRGYIKKEQSGRIEQLMSTHFQEEEMLIIAEQLKLWKK